MKVKSHVARTHIGVLIAKSQDIPELHGQLPGNPPIFLKREQRPKRNRGYKPQANLAKTYEEFYESGQIICYFY